MDQELFRTKLNFKELQDYRTPDDNQLPIRGLVDFYRACGLMDAIEKLGLTEQIIPIQAFYCNFVTLQKIRYLIKNNWETFNLEIIDNNVTQWVPGARRAQRKRPKKLKAIVRNSVNLDFQNLCPGIDDTLEDDILIFVKIDKNA